MIQKLLSILIPTFGRYGKILYCFRFILFNIFISK